jgi:hypothetical protein
MNNINFARNLVKGKIAETIFAQMLRESRHFTVLEFGYEKVIPEMIQQGYTEKNVMIETLKTAPDFAVINRNTKEVKLIEVKYKKSLNTRHVLENAERMSSSWNPSYLFIATLYGFYFDSIENIINNKGKIPKFDDKLIPNKVQEKYLQILKDFEGNN